MYETKGQMPKRDQVGFLTRLLALFVPLWLYAGGFGSVLYIALKQDAVPPVLNTAFGLAGILLSAVFYCLMMRRLAAIKDRGEADTRAEAQSGGEAGADAEEKFAGKDAESKKKKASFAFLFLNYIFGLAVVLSAKQLIPRLSKLQNPQAFCFALGGLVILAFLLMFFFVASWTIAKGKAESFEYIG